MESLDSIIAQINKGQEGAPIIVRGSDIVHEELPRITSGSLAIDLALGGGWPANQWSEVIGHESHGKTTVVLKTIAANQALDPEWTCAWVAAEEFVPEWAETLGCDTQRIHVIDTNVMEEAYEYVVKFLDARVVDCVVIDSLPALVPKSEDESTFEDATMALGARLTGEFTRKARKASRRSLVDAGDRQVTGFMINQWRDKIGVMYGDPRTTPGGRAKNFFYFCRVETVREEWIKSGQDPVGQVIRVKTIKNKSAPGQRVARVDFYFDYTDDHDAGDYDAIKDLTVPAMALDVLHRKGAYYHLGDQKWRGRDATFDAIRSDKKLQEQIREAVMDAMYYEEATDAE